jgi:hypothetical protein
MEFARIESGVVVELVSSTQAPDGNWTPVSLNGGLHIGSDVRLFDEAWNLRPIEELIALGAVKLRTAEDGTVLEKIEAGQIVSKTEYDFVVDGVRSLRPLEYLDPESKTIKAAKSVSELLALGKINTEQAEVLQAGEVRADRDSALLRLDRMVNNPMRWGELSDAQRNAFAQYRRALLDLPQQTGFPWSVEWPQIPTANP